MMLHPRHRGDCADFFAAPHQSARVQLDAPVIVIDEIEHAAAQAGRTWNSQVTYVLGLYLGDYQPDFEDSRTMEDWLTLLRQCRIRLSEAGDWIPFTYLDQLKRLMAQAKLKGQ